MEICDSVCMTISRLNIGGVLALSMPLKVLLHREMMEFALYLADADGVITQEEQDLIKDTLQLKMRADEVTDMRRRIAAQGRIVRFDETARDEVFHPRRCRQEDRQRSE